MITMEWNQWTNSTEVGDKIFIKIKLYYYEKELD